MPLDVSTMDLESVYRLYSSCKGDVQPWILDLRPQKDYKKGHLMRSYSIRLTADQKAVVVSLFLVLLVLRSPACLV